MKGGGRREEAWLGKKKEKANSHAGHTNPGPVWWGAAHHSVKAHGLPQGGRELGRGGSLQRQTLRADSWRCLLTMPSVMSNFPSWVVHHSRLRGDCVGSGSWGQHTVILFNKKI